MIKKILLALLIVFIAIQFIPVSFENPGIEQEKDFLKLNAKDTETQAIIKQSCYDCHSNETVYPNYYKIAPINFFMKHHIEEGREHLNFSTWGDYSEKKRFHKLDECVEEIEEGEMPMKAYILLHADADLSAAQKERLIKYFLQSK